MTPRLDPGVPVLSLGRYAGGPLARRVVGRAQLERFTHTSYQVVPYESYVALAEKLAEVEPFKTTFLVGVWRGGAPIGITVQENGDSYAAGLGLGIAFGSPKAQAQAVQLPTFRYFSVQTTVSVPDRGGTARLGRRRAGRWSGWYTRCRRCTRTRWRSIPTPSSTS